MLILNLDIESAPGKAWVWDLKVRSGYIPPAKLIEPARLLCCAAKWVGEPDVFFFSEWQHGRDTMVRKIWSLLEDADAVLHFNGTRFDVPQLNTEFVRLGLLPPAPYAQIDLYKTVKRNFAFMSSSLDYVSGELGTSRKLQNEGLGLWVKVLEGDPEAQRLMEEYNIGDVQANESLYERLLPWISSHPNRALRDGGEDDACPQCGGGPLMPRGYAYTAVSRFQRYRCSSCGKWLRGARSLGRSDLRAVT